MRMHAALVAHRAGNQASKIAIFFKAVKRFIYKIKWSWDESRGGIQSVVKQEKHTCCCDAVGNDDLMSIQNIVDIDARSRLKSLPGPGSTVWTV